MKRLNPDLTIHESFEKVLINGDDILFCATRPEHKRWMAMLPEFGFEPSAGKNLISDELIQINSELYKVENDPIVDLNTAKLIAECGKLPHFSNACRVRRIGYVNFGLITHRRKNDCSKDSINKPINLTSMPAHKQAPDSIGRLLALPSIWRKLKEQIGQDDITVQRMLPVVKRHHGAFLNVFDCGVLLNLAEMIFENKKLCEWTNAPTGSYPYELKNFVVDENEIFNFEFAAVETIFGSLLPKKEKIPGSEECPAVSAYKLDVDVPTVKDIRRHIGGLKFLKRKDIHQKVKNVIISQHKKMCPMSPLISIESAPKKGDPNLRRVRYKKPQTPDWATWTEVRNPHLLEDDEWSPVVCSKDIGAMSTF